MKRWIIYLLVLLLVLSGCNQKPGAETTQNTQSQTTETTQQTLPPPSLYVPESELEKMTQGALRVFAPEAGSVIRYGFMGNDPVLFAYVDNGMSVIRIDAADGRIVAQATLPESLNVWGCLGLAEDRMVCFDEEQRTFLIYDGQFRPIHTVPVDQEIAGSPVISGDLDLAYYGSGDTLRVLDLNTGISRLLTQMVDTKIQAGNLLFGETVIHCQLYDPYHIYEGVSSFYDGFFSLADCRFLGRDENLLSINSTGETCLFLRADGPVVEALLTDRDGTLQGFYSEDFRNDLIILEHSGNLAQYIPLETGTQIALYDQADGHRLGTLFLEGIQWAGSILDDRNGNLWFTVLDPQRSEDVLCCWNPANAEGADSVVRIGPRFTLDNPDTQGLARCEALAKELESRYGVDICLYKEPVEPGDYAFVPEHQIQAIENGLNALEKAMSKLPEGFLKTAASGTESGSFRINLVREIKGTQYNTVPDTNGLQYWIGKEAYITLPARSDIEQLFYHELCHALETYVTVNSIHYDFWEPINPKEFSYDYSYTEYRKYENSPWLAEETRAFIDAFSMTYPHEDRARIMEYAMMPGNEACFATETMQAKLKQLCMAIREAFGWKKLQESLPWEQYLQESLAYVSKKK